MTQIKYKDFNMNMIAHPITGDLVTVTNEDAIKQSVKNIIQTNFYESPFHPAKGCQIKGLLFLPISELVIETIRTVIAEALSNYEKRIKVLDIVISLNDEENRYNIITIYKPINSNEAITVKTYLKRVR